MRKLISVALSHPICGLCKADLEHYYTFSLSQEFARRQRPEWGAAGGLCTSLPARHSEDVFSGALAPSSALLFEKILLECRRFHQNIPQIQPHPTPQKMSSNFSSFLHLRSVSSSPALNLTSFHKQHPLWFPRFFQF